MLREQLVGKVIDANNGIAELERYIESLDFPPGSDAFTSKLRAILNIRSMKHVMMGATEDLWEDYRRGKEEGLM